MRWYTTARQSAGGGQEPTQQRTPDAAAQSGQPAWAAQARRASIVGQGAGLYPHTGSGGSPQSWGLSVETPGSGGDDLPLPDRLPDLPPFPESGRWLPPYRRPESFLPFHVPQHFITGYARTLCNLMLKTAASLQLRVSVSDQKCFISLMYFPSPLNGSTGVLVTRTDDSANTITSTVDLAVYLAASCGGDTSNGVQIVQSDQCFAPPTAAWTPTGWRLYQTEVTIAPDSLGVAVEVNGATVATLAQGEATVNLDGSHPTDCPVGSKATTCWLLDMTQFAASVVSSGVVV